MIQHGMAGRQEWEGPVGRDQGVVPWPRMGRAKGDGNTHDCPLENCVRDFCDAHNEVMGLNNRELNAGQTICMTQ